MASDPVLNVPGLYTTANYLSGTPKGALKTADNVVVRSRDVLESRRGQLPHSYSASGTIKEIVGFFQGSGVVHVGSNTVSRDTGAAYSDYSGSFGAPDPTLLRMKGVEANQSFYFTTNSGVKVLDAVGSTPLDAGIPTPLAESYLAQMDDSGNGWLPKNCQVAYRLVFGLKDANGRLKLGPPSERVVVINPDDLVITAGNITTAAGTSTATLTGGDTSLFRYPNLFKITPGELLFPASEYDVSLTGTTSAVIKFQNAAGPGVSTLDQTITSDLSNVGVFFVRPDDITTDHFYRLYRSRVSASASIAPDDEMYLVQEAFCSSGFGLFNLYDTTPEELLSAGFPLYTNVFTGEGRGILDANTRPPVCNDLALMGDRLWCANTVSRHKLEFSLIGIGSPDGLQASDTLTISDGVTTEIYTAGGFTGFDLWDGFGPSTNIALSASALVTAINDSSTLVFAYLVYSNGEGIPKIVLEAQELAADPFYLTSSRATCWNPELDTTGTDIASNDEAAPSRLFYSKLGQPDAVPLLNYLDVGSKSKKILRALALRDKLFVFKEDGIFTVSGEYPFRVDLLDDTALLVGPDTAAKVSNEIYCLTTQGPAAVSDSGVRLIGLPIESDITSLFGSTLANVKLLSFGLGYDSERMYGLWLPESENDTVAQNGYIYNTMLKLWTRWPIERTCGRVKPDSDVLYMGHASENKLWVERKEYSNMDYADGTDSLTLSSSTGTALTMVSVGDAEVGDIVEDAGNPARRSIITAVDSGTNTLTTLTTEAWGSTLTLIKAIDCNMEWQILAPNGPGEWKQIRETILHFRELGVNSATLNFYTDLSHDEDTFSFSRPGWATQAWGQFSWGQRAGPRNQRAPVPAEKQMASYYSIRLNIREAQSQWRLHGLTMIYEGGSEVLTR